VPAPGPARARPALANGGIHVFNGHCLSGLGQPALEPLYVSCSRQQAHVVTIVNKTKDGTLREAQPSTHIARDNDLAFARNRGGVFGGLVHGALRVV
jgi:hypothetical protein